MSENRQANEIDDGERRFFIFMGPCIVNQI